MLKNLINYITGMVRGNKILGSKPKLKNSKITFSGKNNILFCDKKVKLVNTNIAFKGDNSIIFLGRGKYCLNVDIFNDSTLHIGSNNYFNPHGKDVSVIISEHQNVFIGNDNLFSFGICIRTADPHLVYDIATKKRINHSKSVYIGDHVWLGQNATILKNTKIHSGSIIGASSVVTNKELLSNSIYAGNPVKLIKSNIHWDPKCVHTWKEEKTLENDYITNFDEIYKDEKQAFISFEEIDSALKQMTSAKERYEYLKVLTQEQNRFTQTEMV